MAGYKHSCHTSPSLGRQEQDTAPVPQQIESGHVMGEPSVDRASERSWPQACCCRCAPRHHGATPSSRRPMATCCDANMSAVSDLGEASVRKPGSQGMVAQRGRRRENPGHVCDHVTRFHPTCSSTDAENPKMGTSRCGMRCGSFITSSPSLSPSSSPSSSPKSVSSSLNEHLNNIPATPRPQRLPTPDLDDAPPGMFPDLDDVVNRNKAFAW